MAPPAMTRCLVCNAENPATAAACGTCGAALSGDPAAGPGNALPPGTRLNGGLYAVGKVLGQGGFGITYLGSNARLRRAVALKEFFPQGSVRRGTEVHPSGGLSATDFAITREKFFDEARILAQFNHPGIVEVYDTFQQNNTAYMVMEFLRGRSLGKLIEERGSLPEREAIEYIERAGEALEVVHRASLLHRDLKPDNIMLTNDGRVVLIDFGTARAFAAGKTRRMTTMLTPGYAPLEQYGQQVRFGAFTDVYALAATLYHLITGQMPTPAIDRAAGVDLTPARELVPDLSTGVDAAITWALEMRIDARPRTVRAFLKALRAAPPAAEPVTVEPLRPPEPRPDPRLPPLGDPPYDLDLAGDQVYWPDQCACCLDRPDAAFAVQATGAGGPFGWFEETRGWEIPYCTACLEHIRLGSSQSSNGMGGLAAAAPLAGLVLGGPIGLLIGMGGAAAASLLGEANRQSELQGLLKPSCVAVGPAAAYRGWYDGTHRFAFLNRDYAESFRRENAANLVF